MKTFLNSTTRNIHWFSRAYLAGELEMTPPFQRNPVWSDKQKSYLIDSILNGYPIPEIYMQETVSAQGAAIYTVVDGQQRIRSVLEFLEGKFSVNAKDSPNWGDMYFDDLDIENKRNFYQYNFIVRQLPEMDDHQLRNVFQRLNRNVVALNKQELRNATYWGPFISLMKELADLDPWLRLRIFSANDLRRMLDVEFVSELAVALLNGHVNKKIKLDDYYKIYEDDFEEERSVRSTFRIVLDELVLILEKIEPSRWTKKSDFYSIFLVFSRYSRFLPSSSDQRLAIERTLSSFGIEIDEILSGRSKGHPASSGAEEYAAGVRNSADLGSRRRRYEALMDVVSPHFG